MALTDAQEDAVAYLETLLARYGLRGLSGWAYDMVVQGHSPTMVAQMLEERPEFKQRFAVIFERERKGLSPMSPMEVIEYENGVRQLMRRAGMPASFYDTPEDIQHFLANDVSLAELAARAEVAMAAAYNTDQTVRNELERLYGVTAGMIAGYVLDPSRALPLIERQFTAARLSAIGAKSRWSGLTRIEAEDLALKGITAERAEQGFGQLFDSRELFITLPGERRGDISRADQLDAVFGGNAAARQQVERKAAARKAVFGAGGEFATSREGYAGIGTANN